MFINNLKEQGINFYRNEMKTFCQSHSTVFGKKKMVVIDDIDNINEQSQQVFRNYMDKYRNNVNFIAASTNIQKVIESIQSRTHIITIHPSSPTQLASIMNHIIKEEGISIDEESKKYILDISNHSIRTLINILEKMYILGIHIHFELCKKVCSNISLHLFDNYVTKIKSKDLTGAIRIFYEIHEYGYSVIDILDYFFTFVKTTDNLTEHEKYRIIPFLCKYITIFHSLHEDVIELAFFTNQLFSVIHS
jgi:DNA polymerase III delta prime subunit